MTQIDLRGLRHDHHGCRLCVRQRAEAADRIEELETIVNRIPPDRLNPWHTVTVKPTGWHMAHPIDCDLAECPFDGLAQAEWSEAPTAEGVWQWHDFDDEPWEWTEQEGRSIEFGGDDG